MALEEMDRIELNVSTVLHAVSYQGHVSVARLLLEVGADRAIQNTY